MPKHFNDTSQNPATLVEKIRSAAATITQFEGNRQGSTSEDLNLTVQIGSLSDLHIKKGTGFKFTVAPNAQTATPANVTPFKLSPLKVTHSQEDK